MHRFIPDPENANAVVALTADQLAAVKRLVRELLGLPADTPVLLAETSCADAGCPLVETVIGVFPANAQARRWRLTRPRAALTRLMLVQTLATQPETPARGPLDGAANLAP